MSSRQVPRAVGAVPSKATRTRHPSAARLSTERLIRGSKRGLDANWRDGFTIPSASLYPHLWSWDSAFISIGHDAMIRHLWDPIIGRFLARNLVTGSLEAEETIVSFAPLLDPDLPPPLVAAIVADLESVCFHPAEGPHFVVPTHSVRAAGFDRRRYWRGPVWLNTNWLLAAGLREHGRADLAAEIVASSLRLASRTGFYEYFDPFDGSGHGSADFGWTAALALDLAMQTGGR